MIALLKLESICWASLRTLSTSCGCGVLNVTCVPPLKSIPRLSPRTPSETLAISDDHARDRKPQVASPHEVDLEPLGALLRPARP